MSTKAGRAVLRRRRAKGHTISARPSPASASPASRDQFRPQLAPGVELLGRYADSGLQETPFLLRRPDGRVVQMPELLFTVAAHADGKRDLAALAEAVSTELGRSLSAGDVAFLIEQRLAPAGLIQGATPAPVQPANPPFLALTHRRPLVSARLVNALAAFLEPLFNRWAIVVMLGALIATDTWLFGFHGIGEALAAALIEPGWVLLLLALSVLSLALHELGHAAACRYGGARPGAIGAGIYLIWPVLYTQLNDSYRLGRGGRLRTDLGGVYMNVVVALVTVAAYWVTGMEPLLALVVMQHVFIVEQFLPWIRLDGYYVVSDIVGVPDCFPTSVRRFGACCPAARGHRKSSTSFVPGPVG